MLDETDNLPPRTFPSGRTCVWKVNMQAVTCVAEGTAVSLVAVPVYRHARVLVRHFQFTGKNAIQPKSSAPRHPTMKFACTETPSRLRVNSV